MTSWLEPQEPAEVAAASDEPDDFASGIAEDFAAGIADETTVETASSEETIADAEPVDTEEPAPPPSERVENADAVEAEDSDFAAGIEGVPELPAPTTPVARRSVPPVVNRPPTPPEPVADDEFGAGIVDESPASHPFPPSATLPGEALIIEDTGFSEGVFDIPLAEPIDVAEPAESAETTPGGESEAEGKTRKPRTRKPKAKADETAEQPDTTDTPSADPRAKPKTRRTRKKAEGEGEPEADSPDDKPKYMGGAERRTSAGDEEPEIQPFFDDGSSFDPDAPNDRFVAEPSDEAGEESLSEESGPVEFEDETPEGTTELEQEAGTEPEGEPEGTEVGRGFNDAFEDRNRDRGRGGRDRGRGGRDRDRGGRDRDRGERGPRGGPGGFKGGPKGGRDRGLPKPKIEHIFKQGQEVIVQVIKEAVGTKGPTLSTYISIAGRYLVLMPSLNRVGVSRKIEDHDARKRLREIMTTLAPPKGVGFIVRTASVDRDAKELRNDLAYLLRLWQVVVKRIRRVSGPVEIYRESDMITRTIRDIFTNDIDTIWVDEANAFAHASEFLQIVMPKFASRIRYFESTEPLFHKYGVEDEIAKIHQKRIDMPLGGSLVIEQTEALVAIDVNSGNFRADNNAEETAFQMNLHAAKEIARQLRLRDLGGVIVNDFIDMRSESHRRKVEDALRDALRRDRARTKILRISQFGIIEMTRQRIRPSLKRSLFVDCPHCRGNGFVKTSESLSIDTMRLLQLAAHRAPAIATVQVTVHPDVAHYMLNKRRKDLAALEERGKLEIQVTGQPGVSPDTLTVRCFDHNGNEIRLLPPAPLPRLSGGRFGGGRGDRERDRERRYPQPLD